MCLSKISFFGIFSLFNKDLEVKEIKVGLNLKLKEDLNTKPKLWISIEREVRIFNFIL